MVSLNKYVKYTILIIIVLVVAIPFSGSYSVQSIDDLAYLVALGFDKRWYQWIESHFWIYKT